MLVKMKFWHKIIGYKAHVGSGRKEETTIFAYAHDVIDALRFYRDMGGVKRNEMPLEISPLSEEKQGKLEAQMIKEGVNLEAAKRIGYFPEPFNGLTTPKI